MIAFKIRTKSSHLVKWKLIQLFYTMEMIHLTYTPVPTPVPPPCVVYQQSPPLGLLVSVSIAWWPHFYGFLCIISLLILMGINTHFSFTDWNYFEIFVCVIIWQTVTSRKYAVSLGTEKEKSKWEKMNSNQTESNSDHFMS